MNKNKNENKKQQEYTWNEKKKISECDIYYGYYYRWNEDRLTWWIMMVSERITYNH